MYNIKKYIKWKSDFLSGFSISSIGGYFSFLNKDIPCPTTGIFFLVKYVR